MKLTKKQCNNLVDAWAITNVLHASFKDPQHFTKKYNPAGQCKKIFKLLDSIVSKMPEEDLK